MADVLFVILCVLFTFCTHVSIEASGGEEIQHIRLVDGSTPFDGRVEICIKDMNDSSIECGTVCNDHDGLATVFGRFICNELGFSGYSRRQQINSQFDVHGFKIECLTSEKFRSSTNCEIYCNGGCTTDVKVCCIPQLILSDANCTTDKCGDNGRCFNVGGTDRCECNEGYTGQNCEISITVCESMPCLNNGTCQASILDNNNITYYCLCSPEYIGKHCEAPYTNTTMAVTSHPAHITGSAGDPHTDNTSNREGQADSRQGNLQASGGIIGGIVAGVALILTLAACFVVYRIRKRTKTSKPSAKGEEPELSLSNISYDNVIIGKSDVTDGDAGNGTYYSSIDDPKQDDEEKSNPIRAISTQGNGENSQSQPVILNRADEGFTDNVLYQPCEDSPQEGFVDNIAYESANHASEPDKGEECRPEEEGFVENIAYEGIQQEGNTYEAI